MTQTPKCADPECEGDLEQKEEVRQELGKDLPYRFHACTKCKLVQPQFSDLQFNAEQMQKLYGEHARRSMTWRQRAALIRARTWCLLVNVFYRMMFPNPETWFMYATVTTNLEGTVLVITATDHEGRIIRRFWEK